MKVTDPWIQAASAKNRGKAQYRKTVDRGPARPGLMITIYGDGSRTQPFCYVADLIEGRKVALRARP